MTDRPRVFLVHVMKTGGTSVSRCLRTQFEAAAIYPDVRGGPGPDAKIFVDKLLELSEVRRATIDCYSVHMPAWVAEHVAPDFTSVTVLREPVSRTISHLRQIARLDFTPDDLEEIYDDPEWHGRLTDYQTRLFALSKRDYDEEQEMIRRFDQLADDDTRHQLAIAMQRVWTTAINMPGPLHESHLERAIQRLDGIDEVATTDTMNDLVERLGRRMGRKLPPIPHANVGRDATPIPSTLEARIRRDTQLDLALYQHARARIAAAS